MKYKKITLLPLALLTFAPAMADDFVPEEDSVRIRMAKELGVPSDVITDEPIKDGSYMSFGPEYFNSLRGTSNTSYSLSPNYGVEPVQVKQNNLDPGFDYKYVLSKAVEGNPEECGVVYYVYFSKDQYRVIKYDRRTGETTKSGLFSYSTAQVADLTNTDFIHQFRNMSNSKFDIFNGSWCSNNVRRNEVFQGLADLNTMDYDRDGYNDLFVVIGNSLTIFSGKSGGPIDRVTIPSTSNNLSPASVVCDLNGDGIDDYLCISIDSKNNDKSSIDFNGVFFGSKREGDRIAYTKVNKTMKASDLASGDDKTYRGTLSLKPFYPNGRTGGVKLAMAVTELEESSHVDYTTDYFFYTCLSIIDVSSDYIGESSGDWYNVEHKERSGVLAYRHGVNWHCGHYCDRRSPFLYGRPALCTAFVDGYDSPQQIFWIGRIYKYTGSISDGSPKYEMTQVFEMPDKHEKDYEPIRGGLSGFDRVVGGQIEAVQTAAQYKSGNEIFAFVRAEAYDHFDDNYFTDWSWDYDWIDINYKLCSLVKKDGSWTLAPLVDYKDDSNTPITLTKMEATKGMQLELVNKEVTYCTPIISHVLCAPPHNKDKEITTGSMSYSFTDSQTESVSRSLSNTIGGSISSQFELLPILKVSTTKSVSNSWSDTSSESMGMSQTRGTSSDCGQDLVVFNYLLADKFVYRIVDCEADDGMVGNKITLLKTRASGYMQCTKTVDKFNQLVAGSSCPQITPEMLKHTVGDDKSYPYGSDRTEDMFQVYEGPNDSIISYSVFACKNDVSNESVALSISRSSSQGTGKSTSIQSSLSFNLSGSGWPISVSANANTGKSESWSHTTTMSTTQSVSATLPKMAPDSVNTRRYRLVYYKHYVPGNSTTKSFMIANWYVSGLPNANKSQEPEFDGRMDGDRWGKKVDRVEYFDPRGCQHIAPIHGMNIKVTHYTDGSKHTERFMNR